MKDMCSERAGSTSTTVGAEAGCTAPDFEPVYLKAEVAEMLRVCPKVVQRERYSGRLGFVRVGAQVRIRHSDLERYIREQSHYGMPSASAAPRKAPSPVTTAGPANAAGRQFGESPRPTGGSELSAARREREITRSLERPARS